MGSTEGDSSGYVVHHINKHKLVNFLLAESRIPSGFFFFLTKLYPLVALLKELERTGSLSLSLSIFLL